MMEACQTRNSLVYPRVEIVCFPWVVLIMEDTVQPVKPQCYAMWCKSRTDLISAGTCCVCVCVYSITCYVWLCVCVHGVTCSVCICVCVHSITGSVCMCTLSTLCHMLCVYMISHAVCLYTVIYCVCMCSRCHMLLLYTVSHAICLCIHSTCRSVIYMLSVLS